MKKKFNVNILMRIAALVVLCVVALGVETAMNISATSATRMQDRQDQLVALATSANNIVQGYAKQVEAGQLTDDAAKKAAAATLSTMRYGQTGYVFVIDDSGISLVNPNAPDTVGKSLIDTTDANGKHFTADMIAGGKANGTGFEAYQYIKVANQPPVDKISYYTYYKPWGWVIGTGVYLDDVAAANQADMWRGIVTGGIIALVLVLAAWLLSRTITGPIKRITQTMAVIAEGNYDVEVKGAERGDELGAMARAVEVFRRNGVRVRELSDSEQAAIGERVRLRAALMQQLQREFGEVVDAAVAGDFTHRVEASFSDAELNQLAGSVNALVETVDLGLKESAKVLGALARQDLGERVTGDYRGAFDRLKSDTNTVADKLTEIVGQLKDTSGSLKLATGEILSGANDLSERTTKQAATIEETSAAMEQLAQTVMQNAQRANEATVAATSLTRTAEEGGEVMASANAAMERITASSSKISNIIGLIDDIAFQTNLLALNASVEAARAGDAGKGFAVVAVEVRRLAQSAASASSEVKLLIEQSGAEVTGGTRLVAEAAGKLTAMVEAARSSNKLMDGIARDSREQASAIEEVSTAVRQMDEMTQHNAALVEEINASIEQTEAQASDLDRIVEVFSFGEGAAVVKRFEPTRAGKPVSGIKALQQKVTSAAKSYLSHGNAAVDKDWAEF